MTHIAKESTTTQRENAIHLFSNDVPEEDLVDLRWRIAATRW